MLPTGRPFAIDFDHRTIRRLLCCYLIFLIYASFIPFHFNLDQNFIRWRLEVFFSESLFDGIQRWSGTDVVTNILVYIPLGLLITGSWNTTRGKAFPRLPLGTALAGLATGFVIELGQTLSPYRSPSMLDALCNALGTAVGAALSYRLLPELKGALGWRIQRSSCEQPILLLIAFVLLAPIADAIYPFDIKITIGVFADNLAMGRLTFLRNGLPSLNIFVEKFFTFATLGYLIAAHRTGRRLPTRALRVFAFCAALVIALESLKVMAANRNFHFDNLVFALMGAAVGTALERHVPYDNLSIRRNLLVLTFLAIVLLGYFQMEPFDWVSRGELRWKIQQIEWFPFAAYYWSDPRAVLFDLLKKLYLSIPVGLLLSLVMRDAFHGRRLPAVAMTTLLGLILEAGQILIRSRTPAITDVLVIASGGWIGSLAGHLYQSTKALNQATAQKV